MEFLPAGWQRAGVLEYIGGTAEGPRHLRAVDQLPDGGAWNRASAAGTIALPHRRHD